MHFKIQKIKYTQPIKLLPFACLHYGTPACNLKLFRRFLSEAQKPFAYTLGLGDYFEFARATYRRSLQAAQVDEDSHTKLDRFVYTEAKELADYIGKDLGDHCLGLLHGNHGWVWQSGDSSRKIVEGHNTTQWLANQLGVDYLGESATLRLEVHLPKGGIDRFDIFASHDSHGSASSAGADLARLQTKIEPNYRADCYITAHTHRRFAYFMPHMVPQETPCPLKEGIIDFDFMEHPHLLIKAGSFYRGYLPGHVTYAEKLLLRPLDQGWVTINLSYEWVAGKWYRNVSTEINSRVLI